MADLKTTKEERAVLRERLRYWERRGSAQVAHDALDDLDTLEAENAALAGESGRRRLVRAATAPRRTLLHQRSGGRGRRTRDRTRRPGGPPMTTTKMIPAMEVYEGVEVDEEPWKWGFLRSYVVTDADGATWLGKLTFHRDDGLQEWGQDVECVLVREVEKTIRVWEPVK